METYETSYEPHGEDVDGAHKGAGRIKETFSGDKRTSGESGNGRVINKFNLECLLGIRLCTIHSRANARDIFNWKEYLETGLIPRSAPAPKEGNDESTYSEL